MPIPYGNLKDGFTNLPQSEYFVLLPDPALHGESDPLPHNLVPGYYTRDEYIQLLRAHKSNPDAIQFLADMLEE